MSAALLLFGIMTIWLPPVRSALLSLSPRDDMRADPARADFQIRAGRRHGRIDDRRRARALCHLGDRELDAARKCSPGRYPNVDSVAGRAAWTAANRPTIATAEIARASHTACLGRRDSQICSRRLISIESANRPLDSPTSNFWNRPDRLRRRRFQPLRRFLTLQLGIRRWPMARHRCDASLVRRRRAHDSSPRNVAERPVSNACLRNQK